MSNMIKSANHQGVLLATRTTVKPFPVLASAVLPSAVNNPSICDAYGDPDIFFLNNPVYEASLKKVEKSINDYCTRHSILRPWPHGYQGFVETCTILDMIVEERNEKHNPKPVIQQPIIHPPVLCTVLMNDDTTLTPLSA
jgi:hypothetical protein